ncbi:MAG: aminoglycoside phosphotransferase family protein [Chthoniobacterales bacterium]|nr:aminoglycoside phosphotransferase family protein [Chthoniobacterales bacterium]
MKNDPLADPRAADFLRRHGWGSAVEAEVLGGGGRHKVVRLHEAGRSAVLKVHEAPGIRDAFARELQMHSFIARHLPADVPRILGADHEARAILFEWVEGGKIPSRPTRRDIVRMADFIIRLNCPAVLAAASDIPEASDAGFGFGSHRECARLRVEELLALKPDSGVRGQMMNFVRQELAPALAKLVDFDPLASAGRRLSPSDFGFHNVLVRPSGSFCFTDFEHAGWDDAAKLAADFLIQPELVLAGEDADAFLSELRSSGAFEGGFPQRVRALLPLQKVKWTTIILNVFHRPDADDALLRRRLQKAGEYWAAN